MNKKKWYLVLDSETCTNSFANEIANGDPERKKRIAIAKPLIYDIAWCRVDRAGNIADKKQFLVAETFSVPAVFNTGYYANKRPIYLEMLKRGETVVKPWHEIMEILIADMETVDAVGAFNSNFDYKRSIPYTELYIKMLYSPKFYEWEKMQYKLCVNIANGEKLPKNPNFEPDIFRFRGKTYPLFDLWGLSTNYLLNNATYKNKCLEHGMLTNSGTFFKTSAESSYRYLQNKYDFDEAHTALDDAIIESYILHKIAQRHAITPGIKYFPFRDLGYTYDHVMRRKIPNLTECATVFNAMKAYVDAKEEKGKDDSNYVKNILKKMDMILQYMGAN